MLTGALSLCFSILDMRAIKFSTALTALPCFPGFGIQGKTAQVHTECEDFPEDTMVVWAHTEEWVRSPHSEWK